MAGHSIIPFLGISLLLCLSGCGKGDDETEEIKPPTNLTITVAEDDSLSLNLSWTASSTEGIEKYIIYFNNSPINEVTKTSYIYKPSSLGDYKVRACKDGEKSSPSNIESTKLVEDSAQGPIHAENDPSGYGWDFTGTGTVYNIGIPGERQHTTEIDFILDTNPNLISPRAFDPEFQHITTIAYDPDWVSNNDSIYNSIDTASLKEEFTQQQPLVSGGTYIFWIQDKYYVKIYAFHDVMADSATFKYGFQKIPGFRRLK